MVVSRAVDPPHLVWLGEQGISYRVGRGTPSLFDADPVASDEWPTRLRLLGHDATPDGHLRLRYAVDRA